MATDAFTKKCMRAVLRVIDNLIGNYKIAKAALISKAASGTNAYTPLYTKLLECKDISAIIYFAGEQRMVEAVTGYKKDVLVEVVTTQNWGTWWTKRGVKLFKRGVFQVLKVINATSPDDANATTRPRFHIRR
jgi:hypothetical protein